MKRGFTLLELVIVLVLISIVLSLAFPVILKSDLNSPESFKIRLSSLLSSAFSPGETLEFCISFKENSLRVGNDTVSFPYEVQRLVLPGKIVSSELVNRYCLDLKSLTCGAVIMKRGDSYPSFLFTFPTGELLFYNLSEAEAETLKDKVEKGRVVEWFSYYSY